MATVEQLIERTRTIIADEVSASTVDYRDLLVADTFIISALNEAQEMFCRETGHIRNNKITITSVADQGVYDLDPKILRIYQVKYDGGRPLRFIDPNEEVTINTANITGDTPVYWHLNDDFNELKLIPAPAESDKIVTLRSWHLPVEDLIEDDIEAEPEIPAQFHWKLAHYAAWYVFSLHDEELDDPDLGNRQLSIFNQALVDGKRQFNRRALQNLGNNQVAVGGNGWSW